MSVASVYYAQNGYPQFMTAIRNFDGNLEVSLWHVDPVYGIKFNGTADAGAIHNAVSIAALQDLDSDVVTAVANSKGDLELIQWFYGRAGLPPVSRGSTTYTDLPAFDVSVATGANMLNPPPYLENAFFTTGISPSSSLIDVSAWNQLLDLQGAVAGVITSQVALASNNGIAITVNTPPASGGYYVRVFDATNSSAFGQVAQAYGPSALWASIAMVDTSSPNATTFAVAFRNSASNLQIQLWNYVP